MRAPTRTQTGERTGQGPRQTMDAVTDLGIAVGKEAVAIIKADHVIVGVD